MNIHDLCDYIIFKVIAGDESLDNLKLQKLMYYCQAWHAAFFGERLVDAEFQAWVHGPVNREIFDRFRDTKSLYSLVSMDDIREQFDPNRLDESEKLHVDKVLNAYARFSGAQLEQMTHRETPWIEAREGYSPAARCEVPIKLETMESFYKARL